MTNTLHFAYSMSEYKVMVKSSRNIIWILLCLFVGTLGALAAIELFGKPLYRIGPVSVRLAASLSADGGTVVKVPPLGRLVADTHEAPLKLTATIEETNFESVKGMLTKPPDEAKLIRDTKAQTQRALRLFTVRLIVVAFLGGAVAAFAVIPRRRFLAAVVGALMGTAAVATAFGTAALSFDSKALMEPRYEGALRSAPWMVKLIRQGFFNLDSIDTDLRAAAASAASFENKIASLAPIPNGAPGSRILVVSDLHNNTAAMRVVSDLAQAFDVSMVLNAGDLTDFGTPFEKSMSAVMGKMPRPHVFVGGNHDSTTTFDILRKQRNTHLPDEGLVRIDGLTILGQSDPSAKSRNALVTSRIELDRARRKLQTRYNKLKEPPDIILVHSPRIAKAFLGKAAIVVNGDDHRMHVEQVDGSVWVDPGTTGASGIRYFKQGSPKDITAVVLYVSKTPKAHAVAADLISISNPSGEFTVQRKRFARPE